MRYHGDAQDPDARPYPAPDALDGSVQEPPPPSVDDEALDPEVDRDLREERLAEDAEDAEAAEAERRDEGWVRDTTDDHTMAADDADPMAPDGTFGSGTAVGVASVPDPDGAAVDQPAREHVDDEAGARYHEPTDDDLTDREAAADTVAPGTVHGQTVTGDGIDTDTGTAAEDRSADTALNDTALDDTVAADGHHVHDHRYDRGYDHDAVDAAARDAVDVDTPADRDLAADDETGTDLTPETGTDLMPGDAPEQPVTALWDSNAADSFRGRWRDLQLTFVDDPQAVAGQARALVDEAVDTLLATLTSQRDGLHDWQRSDSGDTENLRMVVRRYRDFLDRLLGL